MSHTTVPCFANTHLSGHFNTPLPLVLTESVTQLSNENNLLKARNAELENSRAAQDIVICDLEKRLGQFAD